VADTGKLEDGPPIGTATFDTRNTNDIKHCAA
jgi:hypothetical protein